jgi:hypothetical protein
VEDEVSGAAFEPALALDAEQLGLGRIAARRANLDRLAGRGVGAAGQTGGQSGCRDQENDHGCMEAGSHWRKPTAIHGHLSRDRALVFRSRFTPPNRVALRRRAVEQKNLHFSLARRRRFGIVLSE